MRACVPACARERKVGTCARRRVGALAVCAHAAADRSDRSDALGGGGVALIVNPAELHRFGVSRFQSLLREVAPASYYLLAAVASSFCCIKTL